jgi:hypothetical protein
MRQGNPPALSLAIFCGKGVSATFMTMNSVRLLACGITTSRVYHRADFVVKNQNALHYITAPDV